MVAAVTARLTAADIAEKYPVHTDDIDLSRHSDYDDFSTTDFIPAAQRATDATAAMRHVAKQMTHRCLRRWDWFLALRASTDSQGSGQGVWRDKYLGVRASVMLLALHNLNTQLQANAVVPHDGDPGGHLHSRFVNTAHVDTGSSYALHIIPSPTTPPSFPQLLPSPLPCKCCRPRLCASFASFWTLQCFGLASSLHMCSCMQHRRQSKTFQL